MQFNKINKAVNNNRVVDIKFSKKQMKKIAKSGGSVGSLLSKVAGPLMKVAMP